MTHRGAGEAALGAGEAALGAGEACRGGAKTRIGVLVSGGGTNLQALIDRVADGTLRRCEIVVVVSSRPGAFALERAAAAGIPAVCADRGACASAREFDGRLLAALAAHRVDLAVTAGFLTIFGAAVVDAYPNRIINVHPALIPSFCGKGLYGLEPHRRALEYGVRLTGATTHFVTEEADAGPIIMQRAVEVLPGDTPQSLQRRVMAEAEWPLLTQSVRLFSEGRLRVEGRKVVIIGGGAE